MLRKRKLLKAKKIAKKKSKESHPSVTKEPLIVAGEAWSELGLHDDIVRALVRLGFTTPTAIQKQILPAAMKKRNDVIGAAETVSILVLYGVFILRKINFMDVPY